MRRTAARKSEKKNIKSRKGEINIYSQVHTSRIAAPVIRPDV